MAGKDEFKQTNEIKMVAPLLENCDIQGRDITGDALLTQRSLANLLVETHGAHYHFTAKGNQPKLQTDIELLFAKREAASFVENTPPDHGRIETRRIWCSKQLNDYLDFPHVGQVFCIEREVVVKKTGMHSIETVYGITSRPPEQASPERILKINRHHWTIESLHYIIDWNYHEDRSRIRTGFGPENVTRLRRFAIGILKPFSDDKQSFATLMRKLCLSKRLIFDYLRMTKNTNPLFAF